MCEILYVSNKLLCVCVCVCVCARVCMCARVRVRARYMVLCIESHAYGIGCLYPVSGRQAREL